MTLPAATRIDPAASTQDWDEARNLMVDDQLRPSEISNPRVLKAMRLLARQACVPAAQQALAYADVSLPLGAGRVLLQPLLTARLLQAANPLPGQHALVVGAGTGYSAALLASLGLTVTAVESDTALCKQGQDFCAALPAVHWVCGSLQQGDETRAPYDLIYFDGAITALPAFCHTQLAAGGRVVGLIHKAGDLSELFVATAATGGADGFILTRLSEARCPLLPEFTPTRSFAL
ncbi:MAG: protein-L-isoaspartate O-methyltransferase [Acetobacter papayae]|uniref:protein-L-isoaspartate O-methyltransferase family protein n=1 Tax=Acetobacter papayae TaxID=1076592 RepID=UPI0039EC22E5